MSWKLTALSEPIVGQILNIDRDMVIGRHQQADIILQASHVSRRHAALMLKDGQLWIQDLGSSNGTFVNNQKVTEQQLNDGDEINFEAIRFRINETSADEQTAEADSLIGKTVPTDEGMRSLEERASEVQLTPEGMPANIGVPKPAPIPEHIDIHNIQPQSEPQSAAVSENRVEETKKEQNNARIGVISFVILIVLIIIALMTFGGQ